MARILVSGINYAPENIGTGKYTGEMCEWLVSRGHDVRVVTAPPYYPAWKVWPGFHRLWYSRERRNGVDLVRCPIWVPKQPRGMTRILHLASYAASSLLALLQAMAWRPQVVVTIAPTLASAPGAWLVAKFTGARSWLHIQDFEVDAAMDMGIVEAGPFKRLALGAERWLLRLFDRVSTISPKMLERLAYKGVDQDRCVSFPNWADIDAISPLEVPSAYRSELDLPDDAVVALYSGNMGLKQGLELLGDAANALAGQAHLYFVFGGEGPARAALEDACAGLSNVRFLGLQPTERLRDWLGLADIHLLPQRADVADLVMPSKLTGMLASGRAVLATALPGTGVANALQRSGVVTPPADVSAFVSALGALAADPQRRSALGAAARAQALATLSRDAILGTFESQLMALAGAAAATDSTISIAPAAGSGSASRRDEG